MMRQAIGQGAAVDDYEIPDDGICGECGRLVRGHPGVERVLKLRVVRSVPYCRCAQRPAPKREGVESCPKTP